MKARRFRVVLLLSIVCLHVGAAPTVKLKDIAYLKGIRGNQLLGIGLVTGLEGRGDSSSSVLLQNAIANLVTSFGFRIEPEEIRSKNCALVSVSCELPPFVRAGDTVDVRISSLGDARSLEGGVLLQTPLKAANGRVYALAQGQIFPMGAGRVPRTVGTIPAGGLVEQDVLSEFFTDSKISVVLRHPDFVTAQAVASAIREAFPQIALRAADASLIEVQIPADRLGDPVGFVAQLESLQLTPEGSGKVVIDSSSGVIIFGERVRIGKVAISYQSISVNVGPFAPLYPSTSPKGSEEHVLLPETTTVESLVETLKTIGLKTETVIQILKAIDRAGALYGALIVL